jgi:hypothetical protein
LKKICHQQGIKEKTNSPQYNAKRMECEELAPAFSEPNQDRTENRGSFLAVRRVPPFFLSHHIPPIQAAPVFFIYRFLIQKKSPHSSIFPLVGFSFPKASA